MGSMISMAVAGVSWCFCTATASLFSSCCGNDKASTVAPSSTSGRRRSVLLLLLSVVAALFLQHGAAPAIVQSEIAQAQFMRDIWSSGCTTTSSEVYNSNKLDSLTLTESELLNLTESELSDLEEKCAGNSGAYRAAGSSLLFFVIAAMAAYFKPTANREAWPAKYILFLFLLGGTLFIPNDPVLNPYLLNIFRVGAVLFVLFQQLIVIDVAYNFNDAWVMKANAADINESPGAGKKWLIALLSAAALFLIGSIVCLGVMYWYFRGCDINLAFMTVTCVMGFLCVVVQLVGQHSSLFTSSAIFAYGTYLCYLAMSKNPDSECNPRLGKEDLTGIILGMALVFMSMAWTCWSYTAHRPVGAKNDADDDGEEVDKDTGGIVVDSGDADIQDEKESEEDGRKFSNSWKLNIILALVTCWYAMALTGWGAIEKGGNLANPDVGEVSMWMIISSQWLMFALYFWTLVAPYICSGRDFDA